MLRAATLLSLLAIAVAATPTRPASEVRTAAGDPATGHCASAVAPTAVAGRPGWFWGPPAASPRARMFPVTPVAELAPDYVISALTQVWDADGQATTSPDTLVVPIGARVRWHRSSGLHTITDGLGADDPLAGRRIDYLLDSVHPDFDTTLMAPDTLNYFCAFHDPSMRGTVIVSANASVPPVGPPSALSFTRSPWPNPSRGTVTFSVGLPTEERVTIEILDLAGRRVAQLYRDALPPGEHPFHWRGVDANGVRRPAGTYVVRVTDGQRVTARRFSLIH